MSNRIKISLQNGYSLVVEQNSDPEYAKEVYIGIEDKEGAWCQDLAIVRNAYEIDNNLKVKWKDDEFEVLVYGDENSEDYTDAFKIGLYKGGI